ncbi:hypothetical protein DM793_12570 [Paenarthrobacter nitroguajacolicus]|nr:hypothetical protein [Paenarthrobacter nitroguajacolicus]
MSRRSTCFAYGAHKVTLRKSSWKPEPFARASAILSVRSDDMHRPSAEILNALLLEQSWSLMMVSGYRRRLFAG